MNIKQLTLKCLNWIEKCCDRDATSHIAQDFCHVFWLEDKMSSIS
jgi:hypothetical protein